MAQKLKFFSYQGWTSSGNRVKGDLTAFTLGNARQQLAIKHIKVKSLKETRARKVKITSLDIALITRQLQVMLEAGVPLVQSYDLIATGHPNPGARTLAMQVKQSLSDGNSLAESLAKHPDHFDHLYISLIDAGERSGALGSLLDRLAIYKEKSEALRAKIKKATTYPLVIVGIGLGISTGLLLFVVPTFSEIFEGFGAELPGLTQMFVDLSDGIKNHGITMAVSLVGGGFGLKMLYQKSPGFRNVVDRIVLR
ncbi:MAG: type II secretion system F family protein, partial [Proteobacteria bacterium]|nr:type II secretion system F family protein [Pseudomonadota bacterium]